MLRFESPWLLLLLVLLPLVRLLQRRRGRAALRYSATADIAALAATPRRRLASLPALLRCAAAACLIVALARPQRGTELVKQSTNGVAIEMIVDRSGSMRAPMDFDGAELTRLEAVKRVFAEFVHGGSRGLGGRPDDLIGVVAFARYPETVCPLTLAHDVLPPLLEKIGPPTRKDEDGTAVGDAIALAAARLKTAEETVAQQTGGRRYSIKSKVIVLLTDGQNNVGERSPLAAAALAQRWGIKIYAIGIGGDPANLLQNPLRMFLGPIEEGVDKAALQALAEKTGGLFRMAEDASALREIYREIDRMERSEFEAVSSVTYRELFGPWAFAALALLAAEIVLNATLLRRVP